MENSSLKACQRSHRLCHVLALLLVCVLRPTFLKLLKKYVKEAEKELFFLLCFCNKKKKRKKNFDRGGKDVHKVRLPTEPGILYVKLAVYEEEWS